MAAPNEWLEFLRPIPDEDLPEARAFMRRSLRAVTVAMFLGNAIVLVAVNVSRVVFLGRSVVLAAVTAALLGIVFRLGDTPLGRRFPEALLFGVGVLAIAMTEAMAWATKDGADVFGEHVFGVGLAIAGFTPWRMRFSFLFGAMTAALDILANQLIPQPAPMDLSIVIGVTATITIVSAGISQLQRRIWADLHNAGERASAASRLSSIGRLAEGLAHETLTPLASALNETTSASLLLDELSASFGNPTVTTTDLAEIVTEARACLTSGQTDLERVSTLIGSLRAHAYELRDRDVKSFNVGDVLSGLATRLAGHKAPRIRYRLANPDLPPTRGDPDTLERIVHSLVENAVHAISESGVGTQIEFGVTDSGDDLIVWVDDNGPGIAPPLVQQLFAPMVTTRGMRSAVGLGLAIARDLTESVFDGRLELSRATPGARFHVVLPKRNLGNRAQMGPSFRPSLEPDPS